MNFIESISPVEIFLVIALVLFILGIIFRVQLKFFGTRMIYGQYHYKYLKLFNRYLIDRPYPDAIKDEPYDYILSTFSAKKYAEYKTNKDIKFLKCEIGEVYNDFFKRNGNPDYLTISDPRSNQPKFIVAGYKAKVYDYEAMLVYYFSKTIFIMGQFRFRREKTPINSLDLIEKLNERYEVKINPKDANEFLLRDPKGNQIIFRDTGFSVELTIFNPNVKSIKEIVYNSNYDNAYEQNIVEVSEKIVTF